VVLTSDHGYQLGEHGGLWRKDTLFEEALRVPLLIWAPGLAQPGVPTSSLAELVDLYPTLTDLAGLSRPKGLDGTSLVPVLQDPSRAVKAAAFSAARRRPPQLGWSVRTERYRYTEWPDGSREMYDHQSDPGERTNLARLAAQAQVLAELRRMLHDGWTAATARP
jgi:arylsulfatase A-like enzyme